MSRKNLFDREGIPLDAMVRLAGVQVRIDTPLQMSGLMIADEDTSARFTCPEAQYPGVLQALDRYLRAQLAPISLS